MEIGAYEAALDSPRSRAAQVRYLAHLADLHALLEEEDRPMTDTMAPWYTPDQSFAARRIASQNHVYAPVRDIIRDARERMSDEGRSLAMRATRHDLYRQVLSAQLDSRREFTYWRF